MQNFWFGITWRSLLLVLTTGTGTGIAIACFPPWLLHWGLGLIAGLLASTTYMIYLLWRWRTNLRNTAIAWKEYGAKRHSAEVYMQSLSAELVDNFTYWVWLPLCFCLGFRLVANLCGAAENTVVIFAVIGLVVGALIRLGWGWMLSSR